MWSCIVASVPMPAYHSQEHKNTEYAKNDWMRNLGIDKQENAITTMKRGANKTVLLTLSMQLSKSASHNSGGGLVTAESRVKRVGINCTIPRHSELSSIVLAV